MDRAISKLMIGLIRVYQTVLSNLMPSRCRFYPSCSHYAAEAIERFGPIGGSWLAIRRILKCHPWNPGGLDMVPNEFRGKVQA